MTLPPPSHDRSQIVIPAQGMIDIRDAFTDLLNEFGKENKPGLFDSRCAFTNIVDNDL